MNPYSRDDTLFIKADTHVEESVVLAFAENAARAQVGDKVLVDTHHVGNGVYRVIVYGEEG